MNVKNIRLSRGWTQEQLAEMSGVSCRTIQRIERGGNASLESMKCLAAVFEIDLNQLQEDKIMTDENTVSLSGAEDDRMNDTAERVTEIKRFLIHIVVYICFSGIAGMAKIFSFISVEGLLYMTLIWTLLFVMHGIYVVLKPSILRIIDNWEQGQINSRMKK